MAMCFFSNDSVISMLLAMKKRASVIFMALFLPILLEVAYPESTYGDEEQKQQLSQIESEKFYPSLQLTEIVLKNGMRVAIKPTDFDKNEIFIQLVAPGGYSSLSKDRRPSGMLAAMIAKESGLGFPSANQLSYAMYRDTIELSLDIEKSHRIIDGTVSSQNIESLLKIMHQIFVDDKLTEESMKIVVEREKNTIRQRYLDKDQTFEVMHLALNTQNSKSLKSLSLRGIKRVNLEKAQEFYKESFTNPNDFIAIIVGDLDLDKTRELVNKYFGSLTSDPSIKAPCCSEIPSFPEGITRRVIPARTAHDAYTRISIPFTKTFDDNTVISLELMTLYFEKELRILMQKEVGKTYGIDVSYELPLFPFKSPVWITINFHSLKEDASRIEKKIIEKLKMIQTEGIANQSLDEIKKHQKNSDDFWQHDNNYWLASLMNYYLWDWSPEGIVLKQEKYKTIDQENLNAFIATSFTLDNYTVLSSQP